MFPLFFFCTSKVDINISVTCESGEGGMQGRGLGLAAKAAGSICLWPALCLLAAGGEQ